MCSLAPKQPATPGLGQLLGCGRDFWKEEGITPSPAREEVGVSSGEMPEHATPPDVWSPQDAAPPTLMSSSKRRALSHPEHNMRMTSSTFIARVQAIEGLGKTPRSKQGEVAYLSYNFSKNLYWVKVGIKVKGRISSSPCTAVRWVPLSPNLFHVSHMDGTITVYDKDRDDGVFTAQPSTASPVSSLLPPAYGPIPPYVESSSPAGEWSPLDSIFVTIPPWHPVNATGASGGGGRGDRDKATKNLVSHWEVSERSVVDFVFSPDVKYVAAISEGDYPRVIDALAEQLVDCYAAYFGPLTCVAWLPVGQFIIAGSRDDLVNIFSPWERRVIARCQGHSSFLSALAFDDLRCDGRTYRFGSVGEDNKPILWDFSSGIRHRPKLHSHHRRLSMASSPSLGARRRGDTLTADHSTFHLPPPGAEGPLPRYHPAPSRNEVAIVQPVLVKQLENDILTAVGFLPRWLLTGTRVGHVKMWIRPLPATSRKNGHASRAATDAQDLDWVS
ncbi:WD40 repeat-like protein [Lactarius psammicola]|nr:WD40 repeat-like protein [Lactarius psammicola]